MIGTLVRLIPMTDVKLGIQMGVVKGMERTGALMVITLTYIVSLEWVSLTQGKE